MAMHGLLVIDKPRGVSSHDVVRRVRRLCGTRRVGHGGTLDPLATGVLVVAVGEGTRVLQFFLDEDKAYRATFRLGEVTDTQDSEGTVLSTAPFDGVTPAQVEEACAAMVGTIEQIPPMYSALKKDGVPLYKLARQGQEVERQARVLQIRSLKVCEIDLPSVTIEVECSKGTYIRTLCHDIGAALGCGAHLTALRRIASGRFTEAQAAGLDALEALAAEGGQLPLLGPAEALQGWPGVEVSEEAARRLRDGVPPTLEEAPAVQGLGEGRQVLLLESGRLLAVARFAPSRQKERRGDYELVRVFNGAWQ